MPNFFSLSGSSKKLSCRNKKPTDNRDIPFFHRVLQIPILFGDVIIELLGIYREESIAKGGHWPLRGRSGNIREHSRSHSGARVRPNYPRFELRAKQMFALRR